ncbi:MAG: peptidoglycan editing factor PgeF [Proteobacteria bacterium]|nr:peptidoglycan editing factor PgeF [Pseudomonadota bacterium]
MFITSGNLESRFVRHGFFGRQGGVSRGIYDSLNCGPGSRDDRDAVDQNRFRVAEQMEASAARFLTLFQVHSNKCIDVKDAWSGPGPEADAMVTDLPGIALGILTADCAPVLFTGQTAAGRSVIGAAHAGWKGALGGVLENTLKAMLAKGAAPGSLRAAIGPCIGPQSYEVDAGFRDAFLNDNARCGEFFQQAGKPGHFMFDLPGYVEWRLSQAGIMHVANVARDTCADEGGYFSFRRATLHGEPDYGRQASAIMIKIP